MSDTLGQIIDTLNAIDNQLKENQLIKNIPIIKDNHNHIQFKSYNGCLNPINIQYGLYVKFNHFPTKHWKECSLHEIETIWNFAKNISNIAEELLKD